MNLFKKMSLSTMIAITLAGGVIVNSPVALAEITVEAQQSADAAAQAAAKAIVPGTPVEQAAQSIGRAALNALQASKATGDLASAVATAIARSGYPGMTQMLAAQVAATVVPNVATGAVINIARGAGAGAVGGSVSYVVLALAAVGGLAAVASGGGGNNNNDNNCTSGC